jgi:hypothetical protein
VVGFVYDQQIGIAAAISGVLVLFNLWLYSVLGPRLVTAVARQEGLGLWGAALLAKMVLMVGSVWLLLTFLPPQGVALGFVPLMLGTLATGVQLAMSDQAVVETVPTSEL